MKRMKKMLMTLAAAMVTATMMTACAVEEDNAAVSSEDKPQTVTQTIHLTLGDGATRAVTAEGVKTWSEGEYVAVLLELANYDGSSRKYTSVTGQLSNVSDDGKSADLTVSFSNMWDTLKSDGKFLLVYPSTACDLYADDGLDPDLLKTQDGTLATLSSTKDVAVGSGTLNGTNLPTGATVTMENPNCIMKLSLTDSGGINDLTATTTSLVVGDGTNTYTSPRYDAPFDYGNLASYVKNCGTDFYTDSNVKYWTSSVGSSDNEMAVYIPYSKTFTSEYKTSYSRLHVVCAYTPSE